MRGRVGYRHGGRGWGRRGGYIGGYGYGWNNPVVLVSNEPELCESIVNGKTYYGQKINGKCVTTGKSSNMDGNENASLSEIGSQKICTTKKVVAVGALIATATILYLINKNY